MGVLLFSSTGHAEEVPRLQTLNAYTRIQVPIGSGASFHLINGNGETKIVVDRVRPAALQALSGLSDKRVAAVSVVAQGLDKAEVALRLQDPGIQSFAYIQGQFLVVDLWKQEQAVVAKTEAKPLPRAVKAAAKPAQRKAERKPASAIEETPRKRPVQALSRERDLFSRFVLPMPELRVERKGAWSIPGKLDVEAQWKFADVDRGTQDGRGFLLAQKLFAEGKYGLTVKTAEITLRDFPDTKHAEEFRLLQAFAYKKLGEASKNESLRQRADQMLSELAAKQVDGKPLPFHRTIRAYFGQKAYAKQDWFEAISQLEYVMGVTKASDKDLPYLQLMLADAYGKVSQPRRAERMYRFIVEKYTGHETAKEAAYRTVDLLATERNFPRVVELGADALTDYPDYETKRSEALFNLGEAYFWLGQYPRAEKSFKRFTEIASAQTSAALAWVRLGEIAEIARKDLGEARTCYMRAKNGYPFSPGDLVAGVRIARIDVNSEKDIGFVAKALKETLQEKSLDSEVRRMTELVLINYLLAGDDADRAIAIARSGMGEVEGLAYEAYKAAFANSLFAKLQQLNKEGRYSEAIALYDREKRWFDGYGPDSYRAAADSYRGLGLYATSNDLMERFAREKSMGSGRSLASTEAGRDLLLAKAKNSFARGAYAEALAQLPDEDGFDVAYMRAVAEQKLGRKSEAQKWAEKAFAQANRGEAPDEDRVEELAELLIDRDMTAREFVRMEKTVDQALRLRKTDSERLSLAKADAIWYQKRNSEAATAYREWIAKFPKSARLDRARYNLGMGLIGAGKREEAVKVLTELRDAGKTVWSDSARQELELLEWEKKYSSILRTLPPTGLGISN